MANPEQGGGMVQRAGAKSSREFWEKMCGQDTGAGPLMASHGLGFDAGYVMCREGGLPWINCPETITN
jgi:hypothetical protein